MAQYVYRLQRICALDGNPICGHNVIDNSVIVIELLLPQTP